MIRSIVVLLCSLAFVSLVAGDRCSDGKTCPEACCPTGSSNEYYCCGRPGPPGSGPSGGSSDQDRVYMIGMGSFFKDYWALFIGLLIAGLLISIICSVLCCLYCNGCFWHRRRNPDMYAGAFPLGTIIYSPYVGAHHPPTTTSGAPHHHPHHPHNNPPSYYDDSPDSSITSGGGHRKGVRFDNDTMVKTFDNQPKSALKKPNGMNGGGRNSPNLLL